MQINTSEVCYENPISSSPSSPGESGPVDVHQTSKQQLRLVCPNHDKINIKQLEKLPFETHHRAIVYLLVCVAGSEVWCKDDRKAGRGNRMLDAYKRCVTLWTEAQPLCRVNNCLMHVSTRQAILLNKKTLDRRFREYVRIPLVECAAECRKHVHFDSDTGWKPLSGWQWTDVLRHVEQWWFTRQCKRRELDKQRRKRNKYNKSEDVMSGRVAEWTSPVQLPAGWQPRECKGILKEPAIPLISRFCPLLCSGLGFEASPSCFIKETRPEKPACLLLPPPKSTNQHMIVCPSSDAVQPRLMGSMPKTLPSGTDGRQDQSNVRPPQRKANARSCGSLVELERKQVELLKRAQERSVQTNAAQPRLMGSMPKTLPSGTDGRQDQSNVRVRVQSNIRPPKRKANARSWSSLVKRERKLRDNKKSGCRRQVELLKRAQERHPERKQEYNDRINKLEDEELAVWGWPTPAPNDRRTFKLVIFSDSCESESESTAGGSDLTNNPDRLLPPQQTTALVTTETQPPAVTSHQSGRANMLPVATPTTTTTPETGSHEETQELSPQKTTALVATETQPPAVTSYQSGRANMLPVATPTTTTTPETGSHERQPCTGIQLIPPPIDAPALRILARLHDILDSRKAKIYIDAAIRKGDQSVR